MGTDGRPGLRRSERGRASMNASEGADKSSAPVQVGPPEGTEAGLRAALARDPASSRAIVSLCDLLRQSGRAEAALALTAPKVAPERPADHGLLVAHAENLKALGRMGDALATYRRAAARYGESAVAAHNLAAQLGDMSQFQEAQSQARRALQAGLDGPQTWAVLARALQGCNQLEASQAAYVEVLRRAPFDADAHRELAQLVWMQGGDMATALSTLDQAIAARPDPRLIEVRAMARKSCGDVAGAHAEIAAAARAHPHDYAIRVTAAHLATTAGFPEQGVAHAQAAVAAAPDSFWTRMALCEAYLGVGEAARAETIAARVHDEAPHNQSVLANLATAWRLLGDARYQALYDYGAFVSTSRLDVPDGWENLDAYLADLAQALARAHVFRAHPFSQSLVNGTQVSNLTSSPDPAIRAFFQAVAGPIRRRLQALGAGADPFRSRNTSATNFQGVWSVRLGRDIGRHTDHVHPKGWMSSACYVALPPGVSGSAGREGWIKFGEPGIRTVPALAAEHYVEPEPGLLALFPSYMWHGTLPFSGAGERLTIAFDLVPA